MSLYHSAAGPPPPAKGESGLRVHSTPLPPTLPPLTPRPSSDWNFLCPSRLYAPPSTPRTYPPGASPHSSKDCVAGPASAPTLQAPPHPQPQTADGSHPSDATLSSATGVVAGPAPALPAAVSTGSNPRRARPRTCVCVCACVRACVRACAGVWMHASVTRAHAFHARARACVFFQLELPLSPLLHGFSSTSRSYPPGTSPPSATDGVAGPAPAPTLQALPADLSHPSGAPISSATGVVVGLAPDLPAAVSTGSKPRRERARACACECACVRACERAYMRAVGLARARAYALPACGTSTRVCVCGGYVRGASPSAALRRRDASAGIDRARAQYGGAGCGPAFQS